MQFKLLNLEQTLSCMVSNDTDFRALSSGIITQPDLRPSYMQASKCVKLPGEQARREGGKGGKVFPGPATFGGPCRRSKILKVILQMASF